MISIPARTPRQGYFPIQKPSRFPPCSIGERGVDGPLYADPDRLSAGLASVLPPKEPTPGKQATESSDCVWPVSSGGQCATPLPSIRRAPALIPTRITRIQALELESGADGADGADAFVAPRGEVSGTSPWLGNRR